MFSKKIDLKPSASASRQALPFRLFLALVVSQNTFRAAAQTVDNDERSGSHLSTRAASGILLAILGLCFILALGMCFAIRRKRRQRLASPAPPVYVSPGWGGPPRPRVVLSSQLSARHGGAEDDVGSRYWYQGFRPPSMLFTVDSAAYLRVPRTRPGSEDSASSTTGVHEVLALCVEAQRPVTGRSRGRRIAGGVIAGIVVAIVVGLLLCCLLVCLCVRRRRKSRAGSTGAPIAGGPMGGGGFFGRKGRNAGVQQQPMYQAGHAIGGLVSEPSSSSGSIGYRTTSQHTNNNQSYGAMTYWPTTASPHGGKLDLRLASQRRS
ncbi:hypothetical protein PC9H_006952 [Pleurotus ostreatus]|uniref:Uncharacterized protein n=1 Tax=Pleurotus ostreatus TaxID=5322 RepID=A0A8H7A1V5_PLEOS|nr:uncharacterized protein PC9H_006952 [Pleurotus ostreatus]KAF7431231.1 hypothetical protein PC9H_006952 [Pleurotus ostreatus]